MVFERDIIFFYSIGTVSAVFHWNLVLTEHCDYQAHIFEDITHKPVIVPDYYRVHTLDS